MHMKRQRLTFPLSVTIFFRLRVSIRMSLRRFVSSFRTPKV